jgi:hypothetical protein
MKSIIGDRTVILLRGDIYVGVPCEIMPLPTIGEHNVPGSSQVTKNALDGLSVSRAGIVEKL